MDGDSPGSDVLSDGQAIYTPGLYERRGNVSSAYLLDGLGNLRSRGSDTLLCDAFGQTVSRTGTNPLPFGFEAGAGYQSDADSGLTLVGNRYYDGAVGRFLQPDPSGQEDNEYAYAENNPVSNDDPDGLQGTVRQHPKPVGNGAPHKKKPKGKGKGKANGKSKPPTATPSHPCPSGPLDIVMVNGGQHYYLRWNDSSAKSGYGSAGWWPAAGRTLPLLPGEGLMQSPDPEAPSVYNNGAGRDDSGGRVIYRIDSPNAGLIAYNIIQSGWEPGCYMYIGCNCRDFAWYIVNEIEQSLKVKGVWYPNGF